MYTQHNGRLSWMQKDKGTLTPGDVCPCQLFLDPRFITCESGAPWDSQSLQAKASYTSTSSTPHPVAIVTDAQAFVLPPYTFCPSLFLHLSAPPCGSRRTAIVLVSPHSILCGLRFGIEKQIKFMMAFSGTCCSQPI